MYVALGKGLAVSDGCVCRLAGVKTVIGEGDLQEPGLSKPQRWLETSRKSWCPAVLWERGSPRASEGRSGCSLMIT